MNDELRQVLMPLTILGTIGATLVLFTRTISDYILKKKMIEKGYVNEDTQAIFKRNTDENKYSSLKWGLIILFAGISLVILEYIPHDTESPLPYGLFGEDNGIGFNKGSFRIAVFQAIFKYIEHFGVRKKSFQGNVYILSFQFHPIVSESAFESDDFIYTCVVIQKLLPKCHR